ncbi:peptidase M17 [Saccharopolyspora karakumensis]|uniref:Probable cytosol aminopeptidase n=1 Tax=Saccharopolyspora karakumensis TaxID=2530386 RepID=A0A4R5BKM5_9PSEU|nr:peptidase M17 [Saccharopolyspora karakumensis]
MQEGLLVPGSSVFRSAQPARGVEPELPVIPTALVEVDVVQRWRDGVPGATAVFDGEAGPDLAAAAEPFSVDAEVLTAIGASASAGDAKAFPLRSGGTGWVVGVGSGEPAKWRTAGAALARSVRDRLSNAVDAESEPGDLGEASDADYLQVQLPADAGDELVGELTLGLALGGYRFKVTADPAPPRLRKVLLVAPEGADVAALRESVRRARELAAATALARDLANAPSNVKDPAWFTGLAAELAGPVPNLTATVRDEKWLADNGFGGILAVGGGSSRPPRLLQLDYRPQDATGPHLVLVGKGITFDTGGISLKPADGMHLMRTDMSGGAAVIGALLAIARLGLPVKVTGLVPSAENHVSGTAYRPGDVVRHYGGKTTEVGNTDAEGRMVLADAMAYAVDKLQPDLLVDVATLTGAMKVALGLRTGGLLATDDELAERITEAGARVGETWWRMPLLEDHADAVEGSLSDVKQTPAGPGGITAALFLREFTSGTRWAHLDIAGPARADKDYSEVTVGGTGFAARTLAELAASLA